MRRVVTSSLLALLLTAAEANKPATPAQLFDAAKIWDIHLTFTPEQYAAMEPKGGGTGFGGNAFGGPGGGGPGGPRGGRGGFNPGMMLVPAFLEADKNSDQKLSAEEFQALGDTWFNAWDKQKTNRLTETQLAEGFASTFQAGMPPMPFGPGPGGPPQGGPGGPGGRGPGRSMLGAEGGRNGASAMSGINFEYVHADLAVNGTPLPNVAVRYKGNSTFMQSRGSLKRSLKIDLNKYTKGQKFAGVTRLNLHSNVTDAGWMNEPLSYRIFRDGLVPAPRTSWARVYLTIPGRYTNEYLGLYSLVEDVDKTFAQENYKTKEGAIFKPSTQSLFSYLGDDWAKYNQTYDPKTDLTAQQKQRVIDFAKLVTSGSDADFAAQLPNYLDLDEVARYLALNVWLANMDSILNMGQNFYVYLHPETNKFQILPWDLDLSFGGMGGGTELSIEHPFSPNNRFLERLFKTEAFRMPYLAHIAEYNTTILKPGRLAALVDETAKVIRPAIEQESAGKLESFDKVVAGQSPAPQGDGFGGFGGGRGPGRGSPIKTFLAPRNQSVEAQLAGKSQGQQGGGFGGRGGGPGGPGGGGPGGGGGRGFNPSAMLAPPFFKAMDENQDAAVSREEFQRGFRRWFTSWGGDKGPLTIEQLSQGIARDLAPQPPL